VPVSARVVPEHAAAMRAARRRQRPRRPLDRHHIKAGRPRGGGPGPGVALAPGNLGDRPRPSCQGARGSRLSRSRPSANTGRPCPRCARARRQGQHAPAAAAGEGRARVGERGVGRRGVARANGHGDAAWPRRGAPARRRGRRAAAARLVADRRRAGAAQARARCKRCWARHAARRPDGPTWMTEAHTASARF